MAHKISMKNGSGIYNRSLWEKVYIFSMLAIPPSDYFASIASRVSCAERM